VSELSTPDNGSDFVGVDVGLPLPGSTTASIEVLAESGDFALVGLVGGL